MKLQGVCQPYVLEHFKIMKIECFSNKKIKNKWLYFFNVSRVKTLFTAMAKG